MRKAVFIAVFLLCSWQAWGQTWSYLDLEGNGGDSEQIDSPAVLINPGGAARQAQVLAPTISELNFGGAPVISGVDDTACPDGTPSDSNCWSSAIDTRGSNYLFLYAVGETTSASVTVQVYIQDANATSIWIPYSEQVINTTVVRDATNSPTVGTGLDAACASANNCPSSVLYSVGTAGAENVKLFVAASTGTTDEVSIWAAKAVGQDGN